MVCRAVNHGGNREHKIVERKQRQEDESSSRKGSKQGKQEIQKGWRK
jgi:hypothetical protein